MKKKEKTYKERVFEYLDKLPECTKSLDNVKNKGLFIEIVKEYIAQGVINGYCTELSPDLTKLKKFDVILRTPADKLKESYEGETVQRTET